MAFNNSIPHLKIHSRYTYGYSVADDYSKANFEAREERDGYKTLGSYRCRHLLVDA